MFSLGRASTLSELLRKVPGGSLYCGSSRQPSLSRRDFCFAAGNFSGEFGLHFRTVAGAVSINPAILFPLCPFLFLFFFSFFSFLLFFLCFLFLSRPPFSPFLSFLFFFSFLVLFPFFVFLSSRLFLFSCFSLLFFPVFLFFFLFFFLSFALFCSFFLSFPSFLFFLLSFSPLVLSFRPYFPLSFCVFVCPVVSDPLFHPAPLLPVFGRISRKSCLLR